MSLRGEGSVILSPGATQLEVQLQEFESPVMDSMALNINPQFEFLPSVPKFRVIVDQVPTQLLTLRIDVKDLPSLIPSTLRWAVVLFTYPTPESSQTGPQLTHVMGYLCQAGTAICTDLLPEWLAFDVTGSKRIVRLGAGRLPHTCHE